MPEPATLAANPAPLVLFGGTFDPVHRAHIAAARAVSKQLGGAPVRLLPNAVPPHKPQPHASAEQRLTLLRLACAAYPELTVDEWELNQDGPSYSLKTLQHFRQQQGDNPLVFMIGADSFAQLHQWHQWQAFASLCHLAVVPRPHSATPDSTVLAHFAQADGAALCQQPSGLRLMLTRPQLDVSSTAIRDALARKGECPALAPEVIAHIQRHQLYNVPSYPQQTDTSAL